MTIDIETNNTNKLRKIPINSNPFFLINHTHRHRIPLHIRSRNLPRRRQCQQTPLLTLHNPIDRRTRTTRIQPLPLILTPTRRPPTRTHNRTLHTLQLLVSETHIGT
ncbi:hypothetical protein HanIR_Chr09g0447941 [Helianthus annuus]|nr:hypothetical protein HanIR_Chr09g0447941 [Helianthus annuus]